MQLVLEEPDSRCLEACQTDAFAEGSSCYHRLFSADPEEDLVRHLWSFGVGLVTLAGLMSVRGEKHQWAAGAAGPAVRPRRSGSCAAADGGDALEPGPAPDPVRGARLAPCRSGAASILLSCVYFLTVCYWNHGYLG